MTKQSPATHWLIAEIDFPKKQPRVLRIYRIRAPTPARRRRPPKRSH